MRGNFVPLLRQDRPWLRISGRPRIPRWLLFASSCARKSQPCGDGAFQSPDQDQELDETIQAPRHIARQSKAQRPDCFSSWELAGQAPLRAPAPRGIDQTARNGGVKYRKLDEPGRCLGRARWPAAILSRRRMASPQQRWLGPRRGLRTASRRVRVLSERQPLLLVRSPPSAQYQTAPIRSMHPTTQPKLPQTRGPPERLVESI